MSPSHLQYKQIHQLKDWMNKPTRGSGCFTTCGDFFDTHSWSHLRSGDKALKHIWSHWLNAQMWQETSRHIQDCGALQWVQVKLQISLRQFWKSSKITINISIDTTALLLLWTNFLNIKLIQMPCVSTNSITIKWMKKKWPFKKNLVEVTGVWTHFAWSQWYIMWLDGLALEPQNGFLESGT